MITSDRRKPAARLPAYGKELLAHRLAKRRPRGRIVVTDDWTLANNLRDIGRDYPLVVDGPARWDFSAVFALPTLLVMPNEAWGLDLGHLVADAQPSQFWLIWPGKTMEDAVWN